jgi:hypothetical protein
MSGRTITASDALTWLESKAPYSTMERDKAHADIAALVRSLERIRLAAERTVDVPVMPGIDCQKVAENRLRKALDAHRKEFEA